MQKRRVWTFAIPALLAVSILVGGAGTVFANTSTSPSYQMTESQFNSGASTQSCSGQYCATVTIGDATEGGDMRSNTATFDDNPMSEPMLEMIIEPGQSNLGTLTTETTASKTSLVKVRSYLTGYQVLLIGDAPKYNGRALSTSSTPVASNPGTEQFGVNVVANTSPGVGANPIQIPGDGILFGEASDLYKTPNMFKYTNGDVIAQSINDSGQTHYTVSMIMNISNTTPAGKYTGDFMTVLMPVY